MSKKKPPQDTIEAMSDGIPETKEEHIPVHRVDALFTWGAKTFVPSWCASPEHWTSKVVDYLWVDCPCCLFWRGITVGALFASIIGIGMGILIGKV